MDLGVTNKAVGLEIDTGVVRAVEVSGTVRKPKLLNMASISLADGAVEEGMVVQPKEVGEGLRELWSSGEIKHRNVLLGLSNQGVLVRYATMPKVSPEKLENVIKFHAQDHLPIAIENVVMDYQVIGETTEQDKTVLEVLLVAARRDMLDGFLEALSIANLEPVDIDVSTLALQHTLPSVANDRTVAVVNVANGLSNILVSAQNNPRLARLVSVKLKDLADNLGISLDEVLDRNSRAEVETEQIFNAWTNNLISETRSSLTYYQNQANASELEAIVFNGRGARLKGLSAKLEEALGLPVRIVNPFNNFTNGSQKTEESGLEAIEYAICAGLARRGLEGL